MNHKIPSTGADVGVWGGQRLQRAESSWRKQSLAGKGNIAYQGLQVPWNAEEGRVELRKIEAGKSDEGIWVVRQNRKENEK